ncbi:cytochrome c [Kordiimonas sp. SCSIO 12610]|uniref:c-type cytochrome n=1 Tax=Kordiimonas sp. SCSIO 12610 TaxID=2829597 RepID=UPI002109C0A8|nr:cytochrome c [Kordiimonas sp. SCSIO 12610]UTW55969.1 cytochrome c [Kordiimonas sp. SCSIO 12610]
MTENNKDKKTMAYLGMGMGAFAMALTILSSYAQAEDQITIDLGKALYEENCGVCHQVDGSGVPFMQPELYGSPRANGDKGGVIQMILKGSKAVEPGTSEFENEMPGFEYLTDEQIALIATYVRTNFENTGGKVTPQDVASERKRN